MLSTSDLFVQVFYSPSKRVSHPRSAFQSLFSLYFIHLQLIFSLIFDDRRSAIRQSFEPHVLSAKDRLSRSAIFLSRELHSLAYRSIDLYHFHFDRYFYLFFPCSRRSLSHDSFLATFPQYHVSSLDPSHFEFLPLVLGNYLYYSSSPDLTAYTAVSRRFRLLKGYIFATVAFSCDRRVCTSHTLCFAVSFSSPFFEPFSIHRDSYSVSGLQSRLHSFSPY